MNQCCIKLLSPGPLIRMPVLYDNPFPPVPAVRSISILLANERVSIIRKKKQNERAVYAPNADAHVPRSKPSLMKHVTQPWRLALLDPGPGLNPPPRSMLAQS
jgi:hypothetical protein